MADALLPIRVKPRASRNAVHGQRAGRVLVEVTVPPVEGRANDAVRRTLAKQLGIAAGRVSIESGTRSRDKLVRVEGMPLAEVSARLFGPAPNP